MYGEEILDRSRHNPLSQLPNPNSDGYNLILHTIGWLLDNKSDNDLSAQCFVHSATGLYLDLLGGLDGIIRFDGESDEEYRKRILATKNFVLSPATVKNTGAEVYCYVEELDNQITSSNTLLSHQYLIWADEHTRKLIERYVNTGLFTWLEDL